MNKSTVHLRDGRSIDITGLTAEAAIDKLVALGVTKADIETTEHQIDSLEWEMNVFVNRWCSLFHHRESALKELRALVERARARTEAA